MKEVEIYRFFFHADIPHAHTMAIQSDDTEQTWERSNLWKLQSTPKTPTLKFHWQICMMTL